LISFVGMRIWHNAQKHCLRYCGWVFHLPPWTPPFLHLKLDSQKNGRDCWTDPHSTLPRFLWAPGAPCHPSWLQWPGRATKPPNTHRWGKKPPFGNLLKYVPNTKTSLATVKDFNSFTERIKGHRVGRVLTWDWRKAERRSDYCVRRTSLLPCIYSEAPQTSLPLKALPYWHLTFLTPCFRRPEGMTIFTSSGLFVSFLFVIWEFPPNLKKAALKRQIVKTLYGLQTLYLKWMWTWNVEMKSTF